MVLVKANVTLNVMVYSLFMRLLNWEGLCVGKREILWRMIHSSNLCFNFNFMMFICLLERPISPQASTGFKILEIEAIVGRLCQNFCKNLRRKLQQLKQD